ncbi:exported hypothetical protein [Cupriavidus taiwanensis]|uniref:Pyrroline-5-carboxylate reductase catalytic N-terminal domain-containing protein n=1 Tax=Cupriavidus taiwanensis TaxID=164546 RepID=A0A975X761_9BURK|nr:exported hypothetical protein [Cupriavidus taiwanensis]
MQTHIGKTIGIIGAGAIGTAFAKALARHGIDAVLANSRGPETLQDVVTAIGPSIRPGTREEAAAQDIVLVAVNWSKLPQALSGLPGFGGRIVIDANNPIEPRCFALRTCMAGLRARCSQTSCPARAWSRRSITCNRRWSPAIRKPKAAAA